MNNEKPASRSRRTNHRPIEYRPAGASVLVALACCLSLAGCAELAGYSNEPLYPSHVGSIYVEMFENQSFWRGVEFELTNALAKRIEAQTPYKIVSSRDRADSVISGQIRSVGQSILSIERQTGSALEKEVRLQAVVNWKNLRTGELLADSTLVEAAGSYSTLQDQSFTYASRMAANKLAEKIVELMEKGW